MPHEKKPFKLSPPALLPMREVQTLLCRSRQWIYTQLKDNPAFPRPVKTGPRTIAFVRTELDAWIERLPRAEFNGLSAVEQRRRSGRAAQWMPK